MLHEPDRVSLFADAVELLVPETETIEDVHQESGPKQGCDHGQDDTDGQCVGEALDGTGAQDCQNCRRDQGGHVAVDDSGKSFVVAVIDCGLDADAVRGYGRK